MLITLNRGIIDVAPLRRSFFPEGKETELRSRIVSLKYFRYEIPSSKKSAGGPVLSAYFEKLEIEELAKHFGLTKKLNAQGKYEMPFEGNHVLVHLSQVNDKIKVAIWGNEHDTPEVTKSDFDFAKYLENTIEKNQLPIYMGFDHVSNAYRLTPTTYPFLWDESLEEAWPEETFLKGILTPLPKFCEKPTENELLSLRYFRFAESKSLAGHGFLYTIYRLSSTFGIDEFAKLFNQRVLRQKSVPGWCQRFFRPDEPYPWVDLGMISFSEGQVMHLMSHDGNVVSMIFDLSPKGIKYAKRIETEQLAKIPQTLFVESTLESDL